MLPPGRHDVPSGDYEVDVTELPLEFEISPVKFRLPRGGTETLIITPAGKAEKSPGSVVNRNRKAGAANSP